MGPLEPLFLETVCATVVFPLFALIQFQNATIAGARPEADMWRLTIMVLLMAAAPLQKRWVWEALKRERKRTRRRRRGGKAGAPADTAVDRLLAMVPEGPGPGPGQMPGVVTEERTDPKSAALQGKKRKKKRTGAPAHAGVGVGGAATATSAPAAVPATALPTVRTGKTAEDRPAQSEVREHRNLPAVSRFRWRASPALWPPLFVIAAALVAAGVLARVGCLRQTLLWLAVVCLPFALSFMRTGSLEPLPPGWVQHQPRLHHGTGETDTAAVAPKPATMLATSLAIRETLQGESKNNVPGRASSSRILRDAAHRWKLAWKTGAFSMLQLCGTAALLRSMEAVCLTMVWPLAFVDLVHIGIRLKLCFLCIVVGGTVAMYLHFFILLLAQRTQLVIESRQVVDSCWQLVTPAQAAEIRRSIGTQQTKSLTTAKSVAVAAGAQTVAAAHNAGTTPEARNGDTSGPDLGGINRTLSLGAGAKSGAAGGRASSRSRSNSESGSGKESSRAAKARAHAQQQQQQQQQQTQTQPGSVASAIQPYTARNTYACGQVVKFGSALYCCCAATSLGVGPIACQRIPAFWRHWLAGDRSPIHKSPVLWRAAALGVMLALVASALGAVTERGAGISLVGSAALLPACMLLMSG